MEPSGPSEPAASSDFVSVETNDDQIDIKHNIDQLEEKTEASSEPAKQLPTMIDIHVRNEASILKNECEDKPPDEEGEPQLEETIPNKRQRRHARTAVTPVKEFMSYSPDVDSEPVASDSDQDYKPPMAKTLRNRMPNNTPKPQIPKPKPSPKRKSSPKRKPAKRPSNASSDAQPSSPSSQSIAFPASSKRFLPIKIASVSSLSNPSTTATSKSKTKPAKKPCISKSKLPAAFNLLDGIGAKSSELGSLLHSKAKFFLAKNVKDATPQSTDHFIFCVKRILQLLDLAQNNIQMTKEKFKNDVVQLLKDNKCEALLESELLVFKDSNGVPKPPNTSSDTDPLKLSDADSSDCEIIDEVHIPPNTYDVLKKMEKQGISWKNSKLPNATHNLLDAMTSLKQPIRLGKDVILKKVTAPPKTSNESFFCLDGRTLKPPDSFSHYGLFLFTDMTESISRLNRIDWLDLHGEGACDRDILQVLKYYKKANFKIYNYSLIKRLDFVDLPSFIVPEDLNDLFQNFKAFSFNYYNPKTLTELCKETINKKPIGKLVKSVKEKIDKPFILIENSKNYFEPKTLFMLSLNAVLNNFGNLHESFTKREKRRHAKQIFNFNLFKKQFFKIYQLNYPTIEFFEDHLKKKVDDIKKYIDLCSTIAKKNGNINMSLNESNLTERDKILEEDPESDSTYDSDTDSNSTEMITVSQEAIFNTPNKLKNHNLLAKASMLDESSGSDVSSDGDNFIKEDSPKTSENNSETKSLESVVKKFQIDEENSSKNSNSDSLLVEISSILRDVNKLDNVNFQPFQHKRKLDFGVDDKSDDDGLFERSDLEDSVSKVDSVATSSQNSDGHSIVLKKKRKNIKKVFDDSILNEATKKAAKDEEERLKRLTQKSTELNNLIGDDKQFILDVDPETDEKIVIHPDITKVLKKHQMEGIKFVWDSCFETIKLVRENHVGSGCILAHCMGLGKTLQMIALIHSLLTSEILPIKTVLICCPLSTVLNWVDEFHKWLHEIKMTKKIQIYELSRFRKPYERAILLNQWKNHGGVFIVGYEMFRNLVNMTVESPKIDKTLAKSISDILLNPGPDIVVCDEGHLLKNDSTSLAIAMNKILTRRRIVLTGTPLQNNLKEYYCMVNFVKPNLLGSHKEYVNRFMNPITNGQHRDSSQYDIKVMKKRSHVLHKMLKGSVQRKDASILYEFLPSKQEFVLLIPLSSLQAKLYQLYLDTTEDITVSQKSLLKDYHIFQKIWTHPKLALEMKTKDVNFQNNITGRDAYDSLIASYKFTVLFNLLEECEKIGDKVILFSNSLTNLDLVEFFLQTQKAWKRGIQYYRMDGKFKMNVRRNMCNYFNSPKNTKIKLMIVSTRVGGFGINMIGANRVILLDSSWNPSNDIQSIFRVFRFGQKKNCYIYRLVSQGTMEEKIYERSVTKEAIACRVVDEQQIDRHYSISELHELYTFQHIPETDQPNLRLPNDTVLANTLHNVRSVAQNEIPIVWSVHEHDSLLKDLHEEQLNESEQREAWVEYEAEKSINDAAINTPNEVSTSINRRFQMIYKHNQSTETNSHTEPFHSHNTCDSSNLVGSMNIHKSVPSCSNSSVTYEGYNRNVWMNSIRHFKPYKSPIKKGAKSLVFNMDNVKRLSQNSTMLNKKENVKKNLENMPVIDIDDNSCTIVDNVPLNIGSGESTKTKRTGSVLGSESDANIMDLTILPDSPKSQHQNSKNVHSRTPSKKTIARTPPKKTIGKRSRSNTPKKGSRIDSKQRRLDFRISSETIRPDVITLESEESN